MMVHAIINPYLQGFMIRIIICLSLLFPATIFANNAFYISIANQVARKQDLQIITNNAANANTIGYEEDATIFGTQEVLESKRKNNSFTYTKGSYKSGEQGALKFTNNPLDVAIIERNQYFKILTPRGVRYTLSGSMIRNSRNILVNSEGYSFLSIDNGLIEIPEDTREVTIANDGTITADGEEIDRIAVVSIPNPNALVREGESLYKSLAGEVVIEEYTIQSGALRASNVNAARIVGQTIETQRSFSIISGLVTDVSEAEKLAVSRLLK